MSTIVLRSNTAQDKNVYYEFDTDSEPLGEGGMGKVYRGRQVSELTGASRDVAIKFMFDGLPKSVIDRARREASIRMVSENLVQMMDFIETTTEGPNNTVRSHYHVVSELLTGVMLADLLNGVTTTKDGREITFAKNLYRMYKEDRASFALIIMKNIASGIMQLHDKGYIHRDIDPTNIMVTEDGKIKLIDFGIAKKLPNNTTTANERLSTQDRSLTMTGQFMGKPQYAAPELVVGDINYQNETTDIYAMGILLYQLLVGKLPFSGPVTKVLEAQKNTKTPVKNIVNLEHFKDFRAVVAKATEKEQDRRYQSAAEFRVALDTVGSNTGTNWWYYVGVAALAIAVIATAVALMNKGGGSIDNGGAEEVSPATMSDLLYQKETAIDSWKEWDLVEDAEGLFLQSRIYFDGFSTDSIAVMKANLKDIVTPDNGMAHSLLEAAFKKDPKNPKILYELGLDYYYGEERGVPKSQLPAGEDFDLKKSKQYFSDALKCAQEHGDVAMQNRAQEMLNKFD